MKSIFHALLSENNPKGPTEVNQRTVDNLAYTWFGRPNIVTNGDKYWVGGVKDGIQQVVEYNSVTDTKETYPIGHEFEEDDHNQAQILIRASDNRLMFVYAGHNSNYIGVRISTNPLDASSVGPVLLIDTTYLNSYPSPYQASNGNIFIFYRARAGSAFNETRWQYVKSTDNGATWSAPTDLWYYPGFDRTNYLISYQDGNNIHFVGTPGNPEELNEDNLRPYHFVFNILTETATNTAGGSITLPITPSNATLIFSNISGVETTWILDVITVAGVPRMLFVYFPNGNRTSGSKWKARYIYYAVWNGSTWVSEQLYAEQFGYIGKEFRANVTSKSYCGCPRFVTANPDLIIIPKEDLTNNDYLKRRLELFKYDLRDKSEVQLTYNSEHDNWRPITSLTSKQNLLWIFTNDYVDFLRFDIKLKSATVDFS